MKYFSVKCSYGVHERFYKRKWPKHDHGAQGQFVKAAKDQAVADLALAGVAVTSDKVETTQIDHSDGDPGDKYTQV